MISFFQEGKIKKYLVHLIIVFAVIAFGFSFASIDNSYASSEIASGTCGTCEWTINTNGTLKFSSGTLEDWKESTYVPPWRQ